MNFIASPLLLYVLTICESGVRNIGGPVWNRIWGENVRIQKNDGRENQYKKSGLLYVFINLSCSFSWDTISLVFPPSPTRQPSIVVVSIYSDGHVMLLDRGYNRENWQKKKIFLRNQVENLFFIFSDTLSPALAPAYSISMSFPRLFDEIYIEKHRQHYRELSREWSEREGSFIRALNIYFSSLFIMFSFLLIRIQPFLEFSRPIHPPCVGLFPYHHWL